MAVKGSTRKDPLESLAPRRSARKPAAKSTQPSTPFTGFPSGGAAFFRELAAEQNRDWFVANKARYESLWLRPMESLLADVANKLEKTFPGVSETRRKVFRLQRDLRFTTDRTPYKTHASAMLMLRASRRGEMDAPGLYIQLAHDDLVAMGHWMLEPTPLQNYRDAIANPKSGARIAGIVSGLESRGFVASSHEVLKRVPPPYPQDHPRGELLKRKGLGLRLPTIPKGLPARAEFVEWIVEHARTAAPLINAMDAIIAG